MARRPPQPETKRSAVAPRSPGPAFGARELRKWQRVIYGLLINIWWWFDDSDGWFDGELVYGDLMATWWLLDGWCSQFPGDFLLVILWYTVILWLTVYGSPSVVNLWAKWVLETLPTRHDYQVFRTVRNPNQPNKIQLLRIILFIWS